MKSTPYLEKIHGTYMVIMVKSNKRKLGGGEKESSSDGSDSFVEINNSEVYSRISEPEMGEKTIEGQQRNYSVTYRLKEILRKLRSLQSREGKLLDLYLPDFNMTTENLAMSKSISYTTVYDVFVLVTS